MSGSSGGYCPICEKSYPEADRCPVDGFLFQSRDALRPGVVIDGSCKILRRLGAGGMGETFLVRHAFLGENLVLKRIRPELAEDSQYQQSFLREVHSLAALRREPGVVEIRNAWQMREGYLTLLLEYVEGGNLLQWLETARGGGPLEVFEAVAIAADLAKALAAAHAIGVLHRDVKPQNILMRQLEGGGFQLKLCDFGLAVQRVEEMTREGTTTTRLGTPGYAAPEQYTLSSREQDARVDVFGLGMTLYRLAAGRLPWEASAASWPLVCREQPRRSLKELRPALGREYWLENLLLRMTAVERDDRIATAAEALELMQEALAETRPAPATAVKSIPPVELRQPAPPLPAPVVTPVERETPAVPAGAPAPKVLPDPPIPPPVQLRPHGLPKRKIALAASGFVVIALALVWRLVLQTPHDIPGNPPAPVEQGKRAPTPHPPNPAAVQSGNLPAQPAQESIKGSPDQSSPGGSLEARAVPAPTPAAPVIPPPAPPAVAQFVAEPASIQRGQSSTLRWQVTGPATSVSINQGVGTVQNTGSARVQPDGSTAYTLIATGRGGTTTASASVNVTIPPPPPLAPAAPPSAIAAGTKKVNPKDGLTYVRIPPGRFMMGCSPGDAECYDSERPAHEVTITRGFWLGQTPVTQQAYQRVTGQNPSHFKGASLPVETVDWNQAEAYCAAVGGRLPTEAEWEYAARAGSTGARYGNLDEIAWYSQNSGNTTHEVAQERANAFGLYDMLGNVYEWVADWYGDYPSGAQTDPSGAGSGQVRALRGGSFNHGAGFARVSVRSGSGPGVRSVYIGLRCVGE